MDEVDLALSRSLMMNSRTSYSDLGKELGLTPQAVHRRVQALMEAEIIRGMTAYPTFTAMGRMWVLIHGWSRARSMREVAARLKSNRAVAVLQVASGNYLYVQAGVKDANELAILVSFVQREASLHDPQVGLVPTPAASEDDDLTMLDLKIIAALQNDARKPIAELAEEIGTTAKTARRRLDRMVEKKLVWFSLRWQPDTQGDTITNIHLAFKEEVEREKVAFSLIKKLAPGVVRTFYFSNLPGQMILTYWSKNVRDMQRTCEELEDEGVLQSVVPNIIRAIHYYDENRAAAFDELVKKARKGDR